MTFFSSGPSTGPTPRQLQSMRRGVEKESLRTLPDGSLALTPHPVALGAALTHKHITTDFSESQPELITGVHTSVDACLEELFNISRAVAEVTPGEVLWANSMPCQLPVDETIPIGRYGLSNMGRIKSVYRAGLGQRYGKRMQTISGIHYNWSMSDLGDADYLALVRNFRRFGWLLLYLFGASPAVDQSFVKERNHDLEALGKNGFYLPYATSLRMGRLGYQSEAQDRIRSSFNCLDSYASSLASALVDVYPDYQRMGVRSIGGEYNQLNESLLQIENEFYSVIRPKCVIRSGERPLYALRERGIEYVEVRLLDLNPYQTVGIDQDTMRFIDVFLLHCLYTESPPDSPDEVAAIAQNQQRVSTQGRDPTMLLEHNGQAMSLRAWADTLLEQCAYWAEQMDAALGQEAYQTAHARVQALHEKPQQLPSARVLHDVQTAPLQSFLHATRIQSLENNNQLRQIPMGPELAAHFAALSRTSLQTQSEMEAADDVDFETFRRHYTAPERLYVVRR